MKDNPPIINLDANDDTIVYSSDNAEPFGSLENKIIEKNSNKRKTYDDSVFDLSKIDQTKCGGYKIENFEDKAFFTNFPFQMMSEHSINFVIEHNKLHSIPCFKNNYLCSVGKISNTECANLKFDTALIVLVTRMTNVKKHTNYRYMNFNQLVDTINHYQKMYSKTRLENLNNMRTILGLRNKITLYKRLVVFISMNKITKLNTLISVCLNRGTGENGILEKLTEAANGVYKPKQWDQTDKDLGILIMNIGGPSLIKAFSCLNMLPSST